MLMCLCPIGASRRDHLVGMIAGRGVDHRLDAMRVPGHDDVRQQAQGARDRAEFLHRAPMLCGDHAVMDGALQAVDRLALVEQIEDLQAEHRVGEVVAEIEGAEQPAQRVAGIVDGIAGGGRPITVERLRPPNPSRV